MVETMEANLPSYQVAMRAGDVKMLKFRYSNGTSLSLPYARLRLVVKGDYSLKLFYPDQRVKIEGTDLDRMCREIIAHKMVSINERSESIPNSTVSKISVLEKELPQYQE